LAPLSDSDVDRRIFTLRGHKVMVDADLAELYGVTPKRLNEQVKRNQRRFPDDFIFQLTVEEPESLRSQIATLKPGRGQHRKYRPYAFTEHGAVMLASVLNSPAAVAASVQVVRAFVRLRAILVAHKELARKIDALEQKYDSQFKVVFETIRQMLEPPLESKKRPIGFSAEDDT
jgi:hypothetical protein